jgi:fatty-acyl-CoA synthase
MAQQGKRVHRGPEGETNIMDIDTAAAGIFEDHLPKTAANYVPLSPLSFLRRSERVFPHKTAIIHHDKSWTYAQFADRCRRLATGIRASGIRPGECVAVLAPNGPPALEAHYGVPLAGAVLCALNTLLDVTAIAFILEHAEAKVLLVDREWAPKAKQALALLPHSIAIIEIADAAAPAGLTLDAEEYEDFLARHHPASWTGPADEWDAIAVCYTSGTTGNPKGVVYHHRGAYLGALGAALEIGLTPQSAYLWTLPMFHCSGWTFTWGVTAIGATHVCLRKVEAGAIFQKITDHDVTHLCGAPIVLNMLVNAAPAQIKPLTRPVLAATGGAAPPTAIIAGMERLGFTMQHVYGLTEVYGPSTTCEPQADWPGLSVEARAKKISRQGVPNITQEDITILGPDGTPVPPDGTTIGELAIRGNVVMKGYLKNPKATAASFRNGWFLTGDLGVLHPDSYTEIKDRSKDIIISGGENISSLEVEEVLYRHPAIREAAVVAAPDEKWGEIPCAFLVLKDGAELTAEDATIFCKQNLAGFKIPKKFVFQDLPKTSTGKIQKNILRDIAKGVGV